MRLICILLTASYCIYKIDDTHLEILKEFETSLFEFSRVYDQGILPGSADHHAALKNIGIQAYIFIKKMIYDEHYLIRNLFDDILNLKEDLCKTPPHVIQLDTNLHVKLYQMISKWT